MAYQSDTFGWPATWEATPGMDGRLALPIGIQLMGPPLAERSLFRIARFLEREAPVR